MSEFIIQDESLSNIGDAVRDVLNNNNSVTLADLPNTIRGLTNIPTVDSPKLWELSFGAYHVKTGCSVAFNSAQNTTETINFTSALVIIGKNSASANNKQYIIIASDLLNNETYKSKIISGIIEDQIVLNDNSNTQHNYINHSNNFISQSDLSSTLNASSTNLEAPTAKAVYDYVTAVVSNVYKYKGSVATYTDLPTENVSIGDVYNVQDSSMNYAWTGAEWDGLGVIVDISSKEDKINKVSKINGNSTDEQYPSAKATNDAIINTLETAIDDGSIVAENSITTAKIARELFGDNINLISTDDIIDIYKTSQPPLKFVNICVGVNDNSITAAKLADGVIPDVSEKEDKSNKVTELSDECTHKQYPSAKAVLDAFYTLQTAIDDVLEELEEKENTSAKEHTLTNSAANYPASDAVWAAIQAACYVDSEATV